MPVDNQHDFCVVFRFWSGPAHLFQDWVNIGTYQVDGNAQVAGVLLNQLSTQGFDIVSKSSYYLTTIGRYR